MRFVKALPKQAVVETVVRMAGVAASAEDDWVNVGAGMKRQTWRYADENMNGCTPDDPMEEIGELNLSWLLLAQQLLRDEGASCHASPASAHCLVDMRQSSWPVNRRGFQVNHHQ